MSSTHEHHAETGHGSDKPSEQVEDGHSLMESSGDELPKPATGPIPLWLFALVGAGIFWAGAYLFSFSGGFRADVFDFEPKFGAEGGAKGAPDPKVVGKALF